MNDVSILSHLFTLYNNLDLYQLKFKRMDSNVKLKFDISNITSDAAMK